MKIRRSKQAPETLEARKPAMPTHRAIAVHNSPAGIPLEFEIGAAWAFAKGQATGVTVVLREPAPDGQFHLVPIATEAQASQQVTSASPAGNMPHLRAAIRDGERFVRIGDAWRVEQNNLLCLYVRLAAGRRDIRFALFDITQPGPS